MPGHMESRARKRSRRGCCVLSGPRGGCHFESGGQEVADAERAAKRLKKAAACEEAATKKAAGAQKAAGKNNDREAAQEAAKATKEKAKAAEQARKARMKHIKDCMKTVSAIVIAAFQFTRKSVLSAARCPMSCGLEPSSDWNGPTLLGTVRSQDSNEQKQRTRLAHKAFARMSKVAPDPTHGLLMDYSWLLMDWSPKSTHGSAGGPALGQPIVGKPTGGFTVSFATS